MVAPNTFRFLNLTCTVPLATDWNHPARSRLWRYNLHYFDDLNAQGANTRAAWHVALIARWVRENPPSAGTGWEPYPTSRRIVNWVKWAIASKTRGDAGLDPTALGSLAIQARWLRRKLETHLLGNHLLANAKALVFAGAFFAGDEAEVWLRDGLGILERELQEQILSDGGHFERSPMYHAAILEDLLDLINLSRMAPGCFNPDLVDRFRKTATRMLRWLRVMTHPDGEIAFFNDAAFGIAPTYTAAAAYAQRLAVPLETAALGEIEALPDSGYVRLTSVSAVVICDVAPIGPDYLPGHAHADTLSFELSVNGHRVVVNGGTSTYEVGAERERQRSTAAHNTVEVDGENSSEVWGAFRVARRARPIGVRWGKEGEMLWLEGAHDGYLRLPGRVTHRRRWVLGPWELAIYDQIQGTYGWARARLHLHPDVVTQASRKAESTYALRLPGGGVAHLSCASTEDVFTGRATWHPEFGRSADCTVVRATLDEKSLYTRLTWAP